MGVHFCTDIKVLNEWATRTGLTLPPSSDVLSQYYARAHPWLLHLRDQLVQRHHWREVQSSDPRMLFATQCNFRAPSQDPLTISLPLHATSFFSPGRFSLFQAAFQSEIFSNCRHSISAVADILHLLQCLMPGLLTVVMVEHVQGQGTWTTSRGLPPSEWVDLNRDQLIAIFGRDHYLRIHTAASTKTMAFKTECR